MKSDGSDKITTNLGPYKVLERIGQGGMGEVYAGLDEQLHRRVALKVISQQYKNNDEIAKRFIAEGKALAKVGHQNVVSVYTLGEQEGTHYIAMEFVEGQSLDELIVQRNFSFKRAFPIFMQILRGTLGLHQSAVIHRDLKPKNILVQPNGLVKIVDFGIAKVLDENKPELTTYGTIMGSPQYLAPEVAKGKTASVQSDIWALGIIFYEMLVGAHPLTAGNYLEAIDAIKTLKIKFSPESQKIIPEELQKIILKMTALDPRDRYNSVGDILADLAELQKQMQWEIPENHQIIGPEITNEQEVREMLLQRGFSSSQVGMILNISLEVERQLQAGTQETLLLANSGKLELSEEAIARATQLFLSDTRKLQRKRYTRSLSIGFSISGLVLGILAVGFYFGSHPNIEDLIGSRSLSSRLGSIEPASLMVDGKAIRLGPAHVYKSIQQAEDATITVIRYGDGDSHQVLIYFENVDHSFNGKVFLYERASESVWEKNYVYYRVGDRQMNLRSFGKTILLNGSKVEYSEVYLTGFEYPIKVAYSPQQSKKVDMSKIISIYKNSLIAN